MENVKEKITPDEVCQEIYEYLSFLDKDGKPRMDANELHAWLGHLLYTLTNVDE